MTEIGRVVSRLRQSVLARNAAALYGVHLANLALPLVTIPFLARVLRPEGWGLVVFSQSFAAWLGLVVEYGFYLSATRMVARSQGDETALRKVVAGVHGAKLLLLLVLSAAAVAAFLLIPVFRENPAYLLWAWVLAATQGANPFWYFQGVERMGPAARLEVGTRVVATAGVFLFIRGPEDGWIVLALQAMAGLAWVTIALSWIQREVPIARIRLVESLSMLREGGAIFAFRGASGIYMQANGFILGLISSASAVAYFGGAERLIRAAIGVIQPVSQALYPRISHLISNDPTGASRLLRASVGVIGGLGLLLGLIAAVGAPLLVRLILGPGYEAAVPVLRVLAVLPPIVALATVIGIQWALPMGYDRPVLACVVAAGALNLVCALLLAPRMGALGMASAVVVAEATVLGGLIWLAWRRGAVRWFRRESETWVVAD